MCNLNLCQSQQYNSVYSIILYKICMKYSKVILNFNAFEWINLKLQIYSRCTHMYVCMPNKKAYGCNQCYNQI